MSKHIALIGKGKMGSVFYDALTDDAVTVLERESDYTTINWSSIEIVILAVKPQDFPNVVERLGKLVSHCLIISIMAGVDTKTLSRLSRAVIRCMPNTPAKIGSGMLVYTATNQVTTEQLTWFKQLVHKLGESINVESDDWIDKATAISGSGPAYLFKTAEALMASAKHLGFNDADANTLVQQTLLGSIKLWQHTGLTPEQLRIQVTSKGGTTAAALGVLDDHAFMELWHAAVTAAYERTKTL